MPYIYSKEEPLLTVEGVNLTLGGKKILSDVNLEIKNVKRPDVEQGQVLGLLGPSGIGKTQLFRIIAGLIPPDSGCVLVGQKQAPVSRGDIGVVAQDYPLFQHRTVLSNVLCGTKGNMEKAKSLLSDFGMSEHANKYPAQLSGGQRQRVAIAQQMGCSEHFLLMDEPFSGLDYMALQKVANMIHGAVSRNDLTTFVIVTHDIHAALSVCDTVALLGRDRNEDGSIIPGAKVKKVYDLIEAGLAWRPGVQDLPQFFTMMSDIQHSFETL